MTMPPSFRPLPGALALDLALDLALARVAPLAAVPTPLARAGGRVLAEDVVAPADVPAFPRAHMDGWAVRAADTFTAAPYAPVDLLVAAGAGASPSGPGDGLIRPGAGPALAPLAPGQAARIATGGRLPAGADAVVPWEQAEALPGAGGAAARVRLVAPTAPGRHVARPGEDLAAGARLLAPGRRLGAGDVGLLASIGRGRVLASPRPRVGVLATGDELVAVPEAEGGDDAADGAALPEGATFESNGHLLAAALEALGHEVVRLGLARDGRAGLAAAFAREDLDLVVTTGATSTGPEDLLPALLAERGDLWLHGVAMRPGKPVALGAAGRRLHALLPGNPVAAFVALHALVVPLLRRLEGEPPDAARRPAVVARGPLARKLASHAGRTDFVRVALGEGGAVEPLAGGTGSLLSLSRMAGLVRVPHALEGLEAGALVDVEAAPGCAPGAAG